MAVENQDKKYYKINFNRCKVEGYNIFVDYSIYDNQQERQKEKDREPQFTSFLNHLQEYVNKLQNEYNVELEAGNFQTEEEYINSSLYNKSLILNNLYRILNSIQFCFYKVNGENAAQIDVNAVLDILNQCGFKQEWIDDPICYTGGGCLNCGEYKDEIISYSFYYNKLKDMMPDAVLYDV